MTLRRYSPHCSSRSSQSVARRTLRHRNGRTYEFLKQSLINFVACLPGPPREAERDRSGVPKTALSKAVGAVAGFVHATNSNTACQMSASFQAHTPGSFPIICSTRGIADAISNCFESTHRYNSKFARDSSVSYSGRKGTSSWLNLQSFDEVAYQGFDN